MVSIKLDIYLSNTTVCTCKPICVMYAGLANDKSYYLSSSLFQSPAFSWGRSELTDRNVELYPQFFLELITTQLRFHMVSPQVVLLIILTMQSYKFYLCLMSRSSVFGLRLANDLNGKMIFVIMTIFKLSS